MGLLVALFVFILLSPPIITFIQKGTDSWFWFAFVNGLIVWSFVFIMLHTYAGQNNHNRADDEPAY